MTTEIRINLEDLLVFRRKVNEPLFAKFDQNTVELYLTYNGLVLKSQFPTVHPEWANIKPHVNKAVTLFDKRLTSHDFGNITTWGLDSENNPNSVYQFYPGEGKRLVISYIQVRFPLNAVLSPNCRLFFRVYLNFGSGPQPVINLEYSSVLELVRRANSPINVLPTIFDAADDVDMVETEFRYADPYTLKGSPIELRSSLGEYAEMGIIENTPVVDKLGAPLSNPTWAIVNGKQSLDI